MASAEIDDLKTTMAKQTTILEYVVKHTESTAASLDLLRIAVTKIETQISSAWKIIILLSSFGIAVTGGAVGAFVAHFLR
jgi:hypothetical protein